MTSINKIKPIINLFVAKPEISGYVTKPATAQVFKSELKNLKYVGDTFERSYKTITVDEVRKLFPTGKLDENNYLMREIKNLIGRVKTSKKIIDITPELSEKDYQLMADMMNLHNGKYIDVWKGFSDTDLIPNIEKLALFNRTMRLTKQAKDFLRFDENRWDVVVEGVTRKPKDAIVPLLEYKVNSREINEALSTGKITPEVQTKIDFIEKYINLFEVKKDFNVYRGEGGYGILNSVEIGNGKNLAEFLDEVYSSLAERSLQDNYIADIESAVRLILSNVKIVQSRFLSTAMVEKATDKYAKKILWKIKVPKGTKGASIESFNVEREAEAEFLMQKGSMFKVTNVKYNPNRKIWELEALIEQPESIDKSINNAKMNIGV